jgi:hypothetical protein
MLNLVRQAHQVLDRFLKLDAQDSQRAWEKLVELQTLTDELRSLPLLAASSPEINKTRLHL